MPELPEVETTVRELKNKVLSRTFVDIWTDFKKMIKKPKNFQSFKKQLIGKKIHSVERRGKNILIFLSGNKVLLIHQKMTGHLLFGKWKRVRGKWLSQIAGPLFTDPDNRFLHFIVFFDNNKHLALCDQRKFAKVELWDKKELENCTAFRNLGSEPLKKNFSFGKFKIALAKRKRGKIKQVLMDQKVIAGIGNIYSDEILWESKVNPFQELSNLSPSELYRVYRAMRRILKKAIKLKGTSTSDFRRTSGRKGGFQDARKVYRREGEKCFRCGANIKRKKIGNRSAHFCPQCQKTTT